MLKIFLFASFFFQNIHAASLEYAVKAQEIKVLADLIDEQNRMDIIDPKAISLIICIGTASALAAETMGLTDRLVLFSSTTAALAGASIITNTFDYIGYEIAIRKRIYQTPMDKDLYENLIKASMLAEASDYLDNIGIITQRLPSDPIKFKDFFGWGY